MKTLKTLLIAVPFLFLLACGGSNEKKESSSDSSSTTNDAATNNTSSTTTADEKKEETINASSSKGPKRYGEESGIITYEYTGMQTGKETIYFDQWGMREAKYTQASSKISGVTQKKDEVAIIDNDWVYTADLIKKTGVKTKNQMLKQLVANANTTDMAELGKKMLTTMGGKKTGTEEIAGKTCEIWEVASTKIWIWKSITLKTETNIMGLSYTMVAKEVKTGVNIPADKFKAPEGVDYKDLSQMMKK